MNQVRDRGCVSRTQSLHAIVEIIRLQDMTDQVSNEKSA